MRARPSSPWVPRTVVASALLAVATIALAAGCSAEEQVTTVAESTTGSQGTASTPVSSSTTTPSSTTTAIDAATVLNALPACAETVSTEPAAWVYLTLPDWVPGDLPARFELTDAQTYGPATNPSGDEADQVVPQTEWLLAELDGDRVVSIIRVVRGVVADPNGYGFEQAPESPVLDSVRGRPGRIFTSTSRSDPIGARVAEWTEGGDHWRADSLLGAEELAAALEPLSIHGDDLTDTTGRFQVLGRSEPVPTDQGIGDRLTTLTITERNGPGELDLNLEVQIEKPPSGLEGLLHPTVEPGWFMTEIDGRPAIRSAPERNDARTFVVTTLADGSLLSIHWWEEGATYRPLDDASIEHVDETLRRVVTSLRRRTAVDDDLMARLATESDEDGGSLPLCMER